MYFPGDPLMDLDPIFHAVRDPRSRALLVSSFDLESTEPEWALAYRFDIVLGRGPRCTPMENGG
jgi:protocatechuate 3,4-dioxygenase beta subunit